MIDRSAERVFVEIVAVGFLARHGRAAIKAFAALPFP
jgi:hypothetical protein